MNEVPKVVFPWIHKDTDWADSRVADDNLAEKTANLKQEPGKDILTHGGTDFARPLSGYARSMNTDDSRTRSYSAAICPWSSTRRN